MHILRTDGLFHTFNGSEAVLGGINLQVEAGSIYGFLGPNGAGKTTTLRLILGLLRKQEGSIEIFGKDFASNRIESLRKIGSMIETPSIYGHLTAAENLALLQKIHQCSKQRITEVLELVGLGSTGRKRAGAFSLGMKQRLSIAIALLHKPDLLILDEPSNGLDPNGMIEMRELLKRLNRDHGTTILISSHLLSEIDRLVTHIGIINKGRMMFQGTLDELKQQQETAISVVFETSNVPETVALFESSGINARFDDGKFYLPMIDRERVAGLNRQLVERGVGVFEISVVRHDLERIFIDMVSG